jgi:capsular polysaccharide export protein
VAQRPTQTAAAHPLPLRLLYFNGGFLRNQHLRRVLRAAGYELAFGYGARPRAGDCVVVWGKSPRAHRGEAFAAKHGLPIMRIEDAFIRSVGLGRAGAQALGLLIDPVGVHFDASAPSLIETILAQNPLDDAPLLARAKAGMARLRALDISKYNMHDPALPCPDAGYVLVIDQTQGDAAISAAGADSARFAEMLLAARREHPSARIVIKSHPETMQGLRKGHFTAQDCDPLMQICTQPLSPWALLNGAIAVYTVSSQLGMEAIFAGHKPQVFGQPFYAGWGLSDDRYSSPARRRRNLTKAQLFAAAYLIAPTWYNPHTQSVCSFETAVDVIEAQLRARREDAAGYVAVHMRAWKRARIQAMFGAQRPVIFARTVQTAAKIASKTQRRVMVWGAGAPQFSAPVVRLEDGLLRSRGLGAALTPPLSLIADDMGLYYDPARPSRFEALMMQPIPPDARSRAQVFLDALISAKMSKYNLQGMNGLILPPAAHGRRLILVPGQVADDASLKLGAGRSLSGDLHGNLDVLRRARSLYPDGFIIYKPHPDVEAGLRAGALGQDTLAGLADMQAARVDPIAAIDAVDEVFTLTSTLGFEALLRGRAVSCLGAPFYAGWGLTRDLGDVPQRRADYLAGLIQSGKAPPDVIDLVYAALIAYPRYFDPVTKTPCPPEVALMRLISGAHSKGGLALRILAKIQGRFASYAHLWRS